MAIQMRHGKESDFLPAKMVPGEMAVTTDTKKIFVTFAPGDCKRMATYEDMEADLAVVQQQVEEVSEKATEAQNSANAAQEQANTAQAQAAAAQASATQAKDYAEQAKAVSGVGIATIDTAGLVKPDGVTLVVDDSGVISLYTHSEQVTGNGFTAAFRRQGNIVHVYLRRPGVSGSSEADIPFNTYTNILTVPAMFKPVASEVNYVNFNGYITGQVSFLTSGDTTNLRIGYFRKNGVSTDLSPAESVYAHLSYFCA